MKYLLDTHLLLWTSFEPQHLTFAASSLIADDHNELCFSVVSIWEVAIKFVKHPSSFTANPVTLRSGLLRRGFREVALTSPHTLAITQLSLLHRAPFDRILLAQALVEQITLATVDQQLSACQVSVAVVG